eukprot:2537901-Rhodomonas_salina.1
MRWWWDAGTAVRIGEGAADTRTECVLLAWGMRMGGGTERWCGAGIRREGGAVLLTRGIPRWGSGG